MDQKAALLVQKAIASTPSFPLISTHIRRNFCIDVSLVALGIRTAYLLDLFTLSEEIAFHFAGNLHAQDYASLGNLRVLLHRELEQIFFVNVHMLRDRLTEVHATTPWTMFVHLRPAPTLATGTPMVILSACETILSASAPFDASLSSLAASQMIAIAGFLLEYPFSYLPSSPTQQIFLQGTPLCVVECFLLPILSHSSEHLLMKFSYPLNFHDGKGYDKNSELSEMIKCRFETRLNSNLDWTGVRVALQTRTLGGGVAL